MHEWVRAAGALARLLRLSIAMLALLAMAPAARAAVATAETQALPSRDPAPAPKDASKVLGEQRQAEPARKQAPKPVHYVQAFTERILAPRRVLGLDFHGQVFVDALPLNPGEAGIDRNVELRRARILFERRMRGGWDLRGSAELVSGRAELKDLFVRHHFGRAGMITVGNQTEPMGLDELTSALDQPFMESSLPTALAPKRNFGVAASGRRGDFLYQGGLYAAGTKQDGDRDRGGALTGRVSRRLVDDHGDVRHLGMALSHRKLGSDGVRFRSIPEVGIDEPNLVDTGTIDDADAVGRVTLEYMRTWGRWTVQAEAYAVRLARDDAATASFGGGYLEGSWTLRGPKRLYKDDSGVFTRAPVDAPAHWGDWRGRGTVEASARLSRIDLSDEGIDGGTQTNFSLGLTWDIGPRTRLATNAVHFLRLTGPNAAAEGGTALALRFQYAW